MALEASMMDIEGRRLDYELDLDQTVINFEDRMWDLISTEKEGQKGTFTQCSSDADCGDDRKCIDGACMNVHEWVRGGEETGFDYATYQECRASGKADDYCTGLQYRLAWDEEASDNP